MSKFKVGDKVRRKPDSYCYGWVLKDAVCTITSIYVRRDGTQSLTLKDVTDFGWDGYRFELVEEAKPVAPVVPQLPGVPEGYRAVRVGRPQLGELYIDCNNGVERGDGLQFAEGYVILEEIDEPTLVEPPKPVKPAKKVAPTFKEGDKIKCLRTGYGYTKGTVYTLLNDSSDRLVFRDDDGDLRNRFWNYGSPEFELVTESPDDIVIQDHVPAREGIDFGWWVDAKEFDSFVPHISKVWRVSTGHPRTGLMHGHQHETGSDRLAIMCYRKDLPVLPISEKVALTEYLVWDTDGPKCLLWSDTNPTIEMDSHGAWDHAYPTGNTREIEVPIVKP